MEAVLIAIAPALAKLIEALVSDEYDPEAEYQALLAMQRAAADLRVQRALVGK